MPSGFYMSVTKHLHSERLILDRSKFNHFLVFGRREVIKEIVNRVNELTIHKYFVMQVWSC